jgi:hypothetical protein
MVIDLAGAPTASAAVIFVRHYTYCPAAMQSLGKYSFPFCVSCAFASGIRLSRKPATMKIITTLKSQAFASLFVVFITPPLHQPARRPQSIGSQRSLTKVCTPGLVAYGVLDRSIEPHSAGSRRAAAFHSDASSPISNCAIIPYICLVKTLEKTDRSRQISYVP